MYFKEKAGVAATRLALTLLSTTIAAQSMAQNGPAPVDNQVHRVVITGSNISRINMEGPTAVEVVNRAEIERSGAATTVELLAKLPSVGVPLSGNDYSSFAGGATAVSLRGLGAKYTLILLNGRRLASYGFADGAENTFVDLNNIPLAAIDTVEILRDGASAIYGSDAVAGVINFKTRTNYQGMEGTGSIGANQKTDGSSGNLSVTSGWGDLDAEGYNVLLTADFLRRNALRREKHDATANRDYRNVGGSDQRATTEFMGWVRDHDNGEPGYVIPGCRGTVGTNSSGDQVCFTNPAGQLTPSVERAGVSTVATKRLGGGSELFAELGLNHHRSLYQQGYPTFASQQLVGTAGTTNPGVLGLPGETATTYGFTPGDRLQVFHAITEAGRQMQTVTSNTARVVAGWRGTINKWDSEVAVNLNQNKLHDNTTNALLADVSADLLQQGILGTGGYNPFNPANPAGVVAPMLTVVSNHATSRLGSIDWKMSTPELFIFRDKPVGFAWGASASHESADNAADPRAVAGNIINYGGTNSSAGRSLYSAYAEMALQPTSSLEAQLALRGDHYNDFGNTFNPKLALSWRASKELLVRGSATTSFKAPTLPEIGSKTVAYTTVADWARCGPLGYTGANCSYGPIDYLTGNPNLKAEKAKNYAFGFVFEPMKALSLALDWYGIKQRDTIQALDAQYIVDHEDIIPGYAALVGRDPRNPALEAKHPGLNKGRIVSVTTPYMNVGQTNTSGLDLDVSYTLGLGDYGRLKLREVNNYTLRFDQSIAPGKAPQSRLDGTDHPKWSNSLRIGYLYRDLGLDLTARTYASTLNITDPTYTQDAKVTNARVGAYTVWDMNLTAVRSKALDVNVGVNNLFNKAMVYSNSPYNNRPVQSTNDLVGRYIYVNVRYTFK